MLEDQDLLVEIMKLKGFGPWSANIVLLFYLGRANVFPSGDNTLIKAYKHLYKVDLLNKPDHIEWASPYKSILSLYLWRWVDNGMKEL